MSALELGVLLSCFGWTYTACLTPLGWVAERIGARVLLGSCVAVWSLATGLTSLAGGFASLLALRLLLGTGESGVFPCASQLIATEVGSERRGLANGLLAVGVSIGPAIGMFFGGLAMSRYGWRAVFAGLGVISLAWLWPWLRLDRTSPARAQT